MILRNVVCLVVAATVCSWARAGIAADDFVQRRGQRLFVGANEFRFVSWNIPNLHLVEDAFEFLGKSPWRWPDEFEIRDALESVRQMGGTVVRPYVISVQRDDSDMGQHVHVLGPERFNEQAFETLDRVLKIAAEKNIRVIIPLVDNWRWWGGIEQYAAFRGKEAAAFWTDRQIIDDFKKTIRFVVNRRNSLTEKLYKDDPAIFGWETGNELDSTPEWTREIAALLKELDCKHLVIDGRSLHGIPEYSLEDPNVDVVTTHHYPNVGNNNAQSVIEGAKQVAGRKAYFVGEFGFVDVDEAERMLDAVVKHGISGALYWSLRFHRREGGFYWHHEPSGGDLFKAYHWPGFPSGDEYRENEVLPMIRQAAFRIRGLETPEMPRPNSPKLLDIDDPARISWQGSAGASRYDLERAKHRDGPWDTIGNDISDAAVQYRPLFSDSNAEIGHSYFYRVTAKSPSGNSEASNIVGPVRIAHHTLVDEMLDQSFIQSTTGTVASRTQDARKVQEDIHRLALRPGAGITYQLPGSILSARVWVFSSATTASISGFASSELKEEFETLPMLRQTSAKTGGDYGYLTPSLVDFDKFPANSHSFRISFPEEEADNEVQISRVEIRYADPK